MLDISRNHFELFGLPVRFRLDAARLEQAWHALQGDVHPDRHADADDARRRVAAQSSAHVNAAYRTLKDPVSRADYLLQMRGIDALAQTDTALPIAFLERQLERRENADEALDARDARALDAILAGARADARDLEPALAIALDERSDLEAARDMVRQLKFLAKLSDDLSAMQEQLEDAPID